MFAAANMKTFAFRLRAIDKKNIPRYNYFICTAEVFLMLFKKTGERDGFTVLSDECGNTATFDFIEMTSIDGNEYAALCETDTGDLVILRIAEDGTDEAYATVDNDEVFDRVCKAFASEFPEEFDFD